MGLLTQGRGRPIIIRKESVNVDLRNLDHKWRQFINVGYTITKLVGKL